MTIICFECNTN